MILVQYVSLPDCKKCNDFGRVMVSIFALSSRENTQSSSLKLLLLWWTASQASCRHRQLAVCSVLACYFNLTSADTREALFCFVFHASSLRVRVASQAYLQICRRRQALGNRIFNGRSLGREILQECCALVESPPIQAGGSRKQLHWVCLGGTLFVWLSRQPPFWGSGVH